MTREAARAEAIGERAADDAEAEIEKAGEREHQRHRAARGAEIALQRLDEALKRIGAAEADEGHGERGRTRRTSHRRCGDWAMLPRCS